MTITSPCTQECRLDPAGLACLGCGRTLDEIQHWISMGEDARRRVLAELPRRRAAMVLAAGKRQDSASF
jgi:predicted Fe-S protein YdhL (DUF1289 family)